MPERLPHGRKWLTAHQSHTAGARQTTGSARGHAICDQRHRQFSKESVPIWRAERKEGPIGSRVVNAARERGTREQAGAIGLERGAVLTDRVRPVGVKQRGPSGCVGQRERIASRPLPSHQDAIEPRVDRIEGGSGLRDGIGIAMLFGSASIQHDRASGPSHDCRIPDRASLPAPLASRQPGSAAPVRDEKRRDAR